MGKFSGCCKVKTFLFFTLIFGINWENLYLIQSEEHLNFGTKIEKCEDLFFLEITMILGRHFFSVQESQTTFLSYP